MLSEGLSLFNANIELSSNIEAIVVNSGIGNLVDVAFLCSIWSEYNTCLLARNNRIHEITRPCKSHRHSERLR